MGQSVQKHMVTKGNLLLSLVSNFIASITFKSFIFVSVVLNSYVSLRLRVQNGISRLISALCVNCLISIPEYSRIRLCVQNGISRLISALCVNCLISIREYSRIIDYSIIWLSTCVTVFNTCWNFQRAVSK